MGDEDKLNATARHLKWLEMEQLEREHIEKMRRREIEMMEAAADEERREREAAEREEEREYQRELDMMSGRSGRGRAYNSTPTPGVVASQPYLYGRAAPFDSGSAV